MEENEFREFQKIPRLTRECYVTEKIDGTNGQVLICPRDQRGVDQPLVSVDDWDVFAGSRNRWLALGSDNFGFAAWVHKNADELVEGLGAGRHFGEWWGPGIQRGYGAREKQFSLFNVFRWKRSMSEVSDAAKQAVAPACCQIVPILYVGEFTTHAVERCLTALYENGSAASPGFMRPEGVVVFHTAASMYFKKTIEKDSEPKSGRR